MEFEIIRKNNKKYWIIGSIVILLLASVISFVSSRANYRVTKKVNIANGIINWSQSDLNLMAIKVQNNNGEYDNASNVPTSGYILSNKSYCEVNGTKDANISMEYKDGKVIIGINTKNTKCYLFFDEVKGITIPDILAGLTKTTRTDFSTILAENTTGKIYTAEDNDGVSYYFAGAVDNNWVQFGGFYWRMVRINGDGTLRLIYNGTTTDQTGVSTVINGATYKYSHKDAYYNDFSDYNYVYDNAYVGYMYGETGSSTYEATHANTNSSYAKQIIDEWYNTNLNKTGIKEYIDINAGFCGDRTSNTSSSGAPNGTGGYGTIETYYGAYYRNATNKNPSLKCTNSNDLYTVSSSNKGNKALTYPVGLITADEIAYSGGVHGATNKNKSYYLYTGQAYWTMSPMLYMEELDSGNIGAWDAYIPYCELAVEGGIEEAYFENGLRPVINLKADSIFAGDGTSSNPYTIAI